MKETRIDEDGEHRDGQRQARRQPIFGKAGRPPIQSLNKIGGAEEHELTREDRDEYFEKARNRWSFGRSSRRRPLPVRRGVRPCTSPVICCDDYGGKRKKGGGESEDLHGGDSSRFDEWRLSCRLSCERGSNKSLHARKGHRKGGSNMVRTAEAAQYAIPKVSLQNWLRELRPKLL